MMPPPFIGSWNNPIGAGIKKKPQKKKGERASIRQKQSIQFNPSVRHNTVRFVDRPLLTIIDH